MNQLISASAGSGKTHALTTQYLSLLWARYQKVIDGTEATLGVESLLATTFTRKAAGEIFDRILQRLADAALHDEGLKKLRDALNLNEETLTKETCQDLLLHLCRSLHRVQVSTLDGFFQRLCQAYRQEAGLSDNIRMTDSKSSPCLALQKESLQSTLKEMANSDKVSELFQKLINQKASSSVGPKILAILQDISESTAGAQPHHWEQLWVPARPVQAKIHTALQNLDKYLLMLNGNRWPVAVTRDLEQFRNDKWEDFLSHGLAKACLAEPYTYYGAPIPEDRVLDYQVLLAVAKHELLNELNDRTLAIREISEKFSKNFTAGRRREGYVLFSEAPALLTDLIKDIALTERRLDASLKHLLLDEFQDTSDPQWGLLKGFALQAALPPGSVFVVGDAKQAIYGWRGGRAEIFEQFGNDINPLERETLAKSYRSSQIILNVVNKVFQNISQNTALGQYTHTAMEWERYFQEHLAAKEMPGFVEFCVSPVPEVAIAANDADDGQAGNGSREEDADWNAAGASYHLARCAERIAKKIGELPAGHSVGILVRTNKTLAQMVDLLQARGLHVSGEGLGKIADDPAVELILSGLLLADHPGHTAAAYHVACSPLSKRLGFESLISQNGQMNPEHVDANKISDIARTIRRQILSEGYTGTLAVWASELAPFGKDRTARRLEQLLELATTFDALPPMRPAAFVRAVRESNVENPGAAAVRVMTFNRAKGLEFDSVFLPDLDWKLPSKSDKTCLVKRASVEAIARGEAPIEAVYARPKDLILQLDPNLSALDEMAKAEEMTEMLCLLYVAMTRPRSTLHLYATPHNLNKDGNPVNPGLKPAAILRAALCGNPLHPAQGNDWTTLMMEGEAPRQPAGQDSEVHLTVPLSRPELRFRHSDGTRRGSLPNAEPERSISEKVIDLLQLKNKSETDARTLTL